MSKEELLKYLIAEIDLIMHDKDYRFENANGTWYSRESCRDLTNEEVFEELRTELRQFADLEAKLAESEKERHEEWKTGKEWKWEWQKVNQKLEKAEQDKISFAVEQLEKVKELLLSKAIQITGTSVDCVRLYSINEIFSNQINELKGKVEDEKRN